MALLYNVTVTHHFCHTAPTVHRGLLRWAGLWPPWTPSPVILGPRATPSPQIWTPSPVIPGPGAAPSPQIWTPSPVIPGPGATPSPQTRLLSPPLPSHCPSPSHPQPCPTRSQPTACLFAVFALHSVPCAYSECQQPSGEQQC